MIDAKTIVEAARSEIGVEDLQATPVRISCPTCGVFLVSVMVAPNLVRCRCVPCRVDLMALISKDRKVLLAQVR